MYMMLMPRRNYDLFDDFFNDPFFRGEEKRVHPLMKTDIRENENSYVIDVEGGYLNINAKTDSSNDEEEKGKFIRRERYYGECSRSFYIGDDVDEDDIKATFKNGILSLEVPKVTEEEKKPEKKYIEIGE